MKKIFLAVAVVSMVYGLAIADGMENISGIEQSSQVVVDTAATAGVGISSPAVSGVEKSTSTELDGRRQRRLERIQLEESETKSGHRWQVSVSKESDYGFGKTNLESLDHFVQIINNSLVTVDIPFINFHYEFEEHDPVLCPRLRNIQTENRKLAIGWRNGVVEIGVSAGQWSANTDGFHQDFYGHIGNPAVIFFTTTVDMSPIYVSVTSTMLDLKFNLNAPSNDKRRTWCPFIDLQAGTLKLDISGKVKFWGDEYTSSNPDYPYQGYPIIPVQYEFSSGDPVIAGKVTLGMEARIICGLKVGANISFRSGNAYYWLTRTGDDGKVVRKKIEKGLEDGAVVSTSISYEF
ncbi:MAG: hypothetical protein PHN74_00140 [Candidatus Pacebacteria bacterium]|nr:hypothetical protein [Candidatus Paceibacterota bacterium]